MNKFMKFCKEFAANEEGLTVIEYVLGAAMLIVAILLVFGNLGSELNSKLSTAVAKIS